MARIAIAGFVHETNTFAPMLTQLEDFDPKGNRHARMRLGEDILMVRGKRINSSVAGFLNIADASGHEIVPILECSAEPASMVTYNAFESIMGQIAAGLVQQGPFDGVYLELHGAMVYEGYNDGETEILRRVRAIVGDIPIVVSLDLHGNITRRSFEIADAMVGYRTYPHIDLFETGERCARVLDHLLAGKPLYKSFSQIPFLMPIHRQSTNTEPNKTIYAQIDDVESDPQVISATIMCGFGPADIEEMGPSVWAYATTQEKAIKAANRLYQAILDHESEFTMALYQPDEAIQQGLQIARKVGKPAILADVQDNSGGGATSDTTGILDALVRCQASEAAIGLVYDPAAAAAAHAAGEGAQITIDLGGKLTPGQTPFHGTFKVVKLHEGPFDPTGPMGHGVTTDLGKMAHLQIDGVHVAVSSVRTQCNDQAYFTVVGIEPKTMQIVVVKSANHYRADFEPISSAIFPVESPGSIPEDPRKAPYVHLRDGIRLIGNGPVFHKP